MAELRSRFRELTEHLKKKAELYGIPAENCDSETADILLESGGHGETEVGWHIATLRYRGVLLIERLTEATAVRLALHARTWLDDYDDTRSRFRLGDPTVSLIPLDASGLVDFVLSADFADPVLASENPEGEFEWDGRRFDLGGYQLGVAERGDVRGARTDV